MAEMAERMIGRAIDSLLNFARMRDHGNRTLAASMSFSSLMDASLISWTEAPTSRKDPTKKQAIMTP
jgi:hypothetical protein